MLFNFNRLTLDNNTGKSYFAGTVIYNGKVYFNSEIFDVFSTCQTIADVKARILSLEGFYSIVLCLKDNVILISDKINSIPLFFNSEYATDHSEFQKYNTCDKQSEVLFQLSGVMPRNQCFNKNLTSTSPGEIVVINSINSTIETIQHSCFFDLQPTDSFKSNSVNSGNWKEEYKTTISKAIDNIKIISSGKKILLPLSGGFDSRLLANMLHSAGLSNVLCFTYGVPNSKEVQTSKAVAAHYGFEWFFVEYGAKEWRNLLNSELYLVFTKTFSSENSVRHLQDFIAINYILENYSLEPSDTIVMPGHALDFLAGNHIPVFCFTKGLVSTHDLVDYIENRHYSLRYKSSREKGLAWDYIKDRLVELGCKAPFPDHITSDDAIRLYMRFNFFERQTKFILNSLRIYDYFKLNWYLPLWSDQYISFYERCEPLLLKNRYIPVEWDRLFIREQFAETTRVIIYTKDTVKPIRGKLFLTSRIFLRKCGVYNLITSFYLIRKVFFTDDFAWFTGLSLIKKVFGIAKGYKEIYSYYANER